MKLSFRQGIARFQTDVLSSPSFLQWTAGGGNFVDLIVAPDPTVICFAHKSANYIVEELKTVQQAWGPIPGSGTTYLFWDINLVTGGITRGMTLLPPMFSGTSPNAPVIDQHWFDTTDVQMRVWNGSKWLDKIRVFAAYVTSGGIIRPYQLGSQAGINGNFEGGNLILDAYNKPLRQSDGSFLTTTTGMIVVNGAGKKVKFETDVLTGLAQEPIPKFSLVQMRAGRKIVLARSNQYLTRIAGIVCEDLYMNEVGYVISDGLIRNENWSWPPSSVNRPLFCNNNGELTLTPPTVGVLQAAGFVYDTDSVYINIFVPIILDDITNVITPPPPPPPPLAPIADFYVGGPTTGQAPFGVTFVNSTLGGSPTFEWDFTNDGTVDSTLTSPSYIFAAPGVYTVRLRATNGFGVDEEIKTGFITVTLAPPTGLMTNLDINLGGPSQVQRNQTFQLSVTVSNDGAITATNVARVLTIPDVANNQVIVSNLPVGSTQVRSSGRTIVTLPVIPTLTSGQTYGPQFITLKAPPNGNKITVQGNVQSPEVDSTIGDNTVSLSIQIKP